MFDVSFWELLIIAAIALVVVGPERLPRLVRTIGLWMGRARASFQSVRDEVEREVNAEGLRETRDAVNRKARETEREVNEAVNSTTQSTTTSTKQSKDDGEH
ncbi:MAG: Sec-independent protein translocase protein TatB [Spiribacter sp.]|jgi:sec-independent protein translocase protein TatB|nr:Sec-independent protein translocase protein TatB [Spiribacter sp.]MDR9489413.1 Sec-independent protein translocase protein TatB [Spiribacter sp.]